MAPKMGLPWLQSTSQMRLEIENVPSHAVKMFGLDTSQQQLAAAVLNLASPFSRCKHERIFGTSPHYGVLFVCLKQSFLNFLQLLEACIQFFFPVRESLCHLLLSSHELCSEEGTWEFPQLKYSWL